MTPDLPRVIITIRLEGAVEVTLEGLEGAEAARRLAAWTDRDHRIGRLVMAAIELAQPRPSDLPEDEALLERLAAALALPDERDALEAALGAEIPWGTFASCTLRAVIQSESPERVRAWFAWALAYQREERDRDFAAAVRLVARELGYDAEPRAEGAA